MGREMAMPPLDPTELPFLTEEPRLSTITQLMPTAETLLRSPMKELPLMDLLPLLLPMLPPLLPTLDLWLPMLPPLFPTLGLLLLMPDLPLLPMLLLLLPTVPLLLLAMALSSMVKQ